MADHIDAELSRELGWVPGSSSNNFDAADFFNSPAGIGYDDDEDQQPEIDPPRIPDYDGLKRHPHYKQYFAPHKYRKFPCWMYHPAKPAVLIDEFDSRPVMRKTSKGPGVPYIQRVPNIEKCQAKLRELGPEWSPEPFLDGRGKPLGVAEDRRGKNTPPETDGQRQTRFLEELTRTLRSQPGGGGMDSTMIATIIATTMKMMGETKSEGVAMPPDPPRAVPAFDAFVDKEAVGEQSREPELTSEVVADAQADIEKRALVELAEREGVKIDRRWSAAKIKDALGL